MIPFPSPMLAAAPGPIGDGLNDVAAPVPQVAMAFWNLYPTSYSGPCITVERLSDNATLDVGFSGGVLNTAAIASFCGASDGVMVTWYNQRSGSVGIYFLTTGNRPKIYDGATGQMVTDSTGKLGWQMGVASRYAIPVFDNTGFSSTLGFMVRFETTDTLATIIANTPTNSFYVGCIQSGSTATQLCSANGSFSVGTHYRSGSKLTVANRGDLYTALVTGTPARYFGVVNNGTAYNYTLGVYQGSPTNTISMNNGYYSSYALKYTNALTDGEVALVDAYLAANLV